MKISIKYKQSIITTIKKRKSSRTYLPVQIDTKKIESLLEAIDVINNKSYRFIISSRKTGNNISERIGTYGVIKGANTYLLGILNKNIQNKKDTAIHFGYEFEQIILKATELELGTCWIAGTFNPIMFKNNINLKTNEKIFMVSPVGIMSEKPHLISRFFTGSGKPKTRKPWSEIFFDNEKNAPMLKEEMGTYATALEMVRLAPSATNSQPWRVYKDNQNFHFFAAKVKYYDLITIDFLRYNDLGIALSHFELTCRELGLKGKWISNLQAEKINPNLEYIRTWATT